MWVNIVAEEHFSLLQNTLYLANRDGYDTVEDISVAKAVSAKEFYASFGKKFDAKTGNSQALSFLEMQNLIRRIRGQYF